MLYPGTLPTSLKPSFRKTCSATLSDSVYKVCDQCVSMVMKSRGGRSLAHKNCPPCLSGISYKRLDQYLRQALPPPIAVDQEILNNTSVPGRLKVREHDDTDKIGTRRLLGGVQLIEGHVDSSGAIINFFNALPPPRTQLITGRRCMKSRYRMVIFYARRMQGC